MLSFHAQLKVFVATAPCDLRMNFNGLWTAAQQLLGEPENFIKKSRNGDLGPTSVGLK